MMKLLATSLLLVATFYTYGQNEPSNERHSQVKREAATSNFEGLEKLFLSGQLPEDFPQMTSYSNHEIYKKVVQGYINTHSEMIDPSVALSMGFTIPTSPIGTEKELNHDKRKRTEPVSEESKQLKNEKSNQLNKN